VARFIPFVFASSILAWIVAVPSRAQQADKPNQAATAEAPSSAPNTHPGSSIGPSGGLTDQIAAATQLFQTGKFADAEGAYRLVLQGNPKSAPAYIGLFRVLLRERRQEDAANALAKAVELEPGSDAVRTAQGEMHFRQGRIQEARADFMPLAKAGTSEARAYLGLAKIYWAESNYQHGKLLFDMAHERDPEDPEIRRQWLFTLKGEELLKELKRYLGGAADDEEDDREHLQTSLTELSEDVQKGGRGCRLVSDVKEEQMPLERLMSGADRMRGAGLKVQLNNVKSKLLLDSGSSGILVSRKIAEKAGIKPLAESDIHGIGDKGTVKSFIGTADSITIGKLEFQGCRVEVMDRNSVADEDGLIGSDVFSHFLVNINFPDYRLELTPLPPVPPPSPAEKALVEKYPKTARFRDRFVPPEFKDFTAIYRFGHDLLIPTRINDLPPKLFLIDTGAFSDSISPEAAREVTKTHGDSGYQVKGLNGAVNNVFTADKLTLTFSHFRQPARDMVAFDTSRISPPTEPEISGFLGFGMLFQMQVKIDYRDGLADFVYDPNRYH
jgi:tetratricopeptide (TPR) repeat protein